MPKFFVKTNQIEGKAIKIIGEDVNHIKNVLRKKTGDNIEICNKDTQDNYIAKILDIDDSNIQCEIIEKLEKNTECGLHIHIFQGLPKADKMELIIQKSVELGVAEITPVSMKRCVVKIEKKDENKKIARWQKISEVAAKQSERNIIPKINHIINIEEMVELYKNYDVILVAYEKEENVTLKSELKRIKDKNLNKIAVVIGPEGGLDIEEVETLKNNGARIVTLGKRILRTETVALNIISILTYELEM